ncbi:DUF397 domain-containing protein [Spirillospora sp. CA-142024]|uniref:DUF397 domain-containing protein n=1 Tax=Spirillospora sp. CA-142024 TaxID=3240036 RepID=UPI003D931644
MKYSTHGKWRKSSYSTQEGGACVELADLGEALGVRDSTDPHGPILRFGRDAMAGLLTHIKSGKLAWRKSSYTSQEGGTCVELADLDAAVGVRDSTDPHGPVLRFGREAVAGLLGRIKSGELDR